MLLFGEFEDAIWCLIQQREQGAFYVDGWRYFRGGKSFGLYLGKQGELKRIKRELRNAKLNFESSKSNLSDICYSRSSLVSKS